METLFERIVNRQPNDNFEEMIVKIMEADSVDRIMEDPAEKYQDFDTFFIGIEDDLKAQLGDNQLTLDFNKVKEDMEVFWKVSKRLRELVIERDIEYQVMRTLDIFEALGDDEEFVSYVTAQWMRMLNGMKIMENGNV